MGHEAVTAAVALELAAETDQLMFGPMIAAKSLLLAERLVEIRVPGWSLIPTSRANGRPNRRRRSSR